MAELQLAAAAPSGNATRISSRRTYSNSTFNSTRLPRFAAAPRGRLSAAVPDSHNGLALLSDDRPQPQPQPAEEGILYSEKFTVRCYEEVACNQVRTLGFSTDGFATTLSMRKLHLIWVTIRMHIEMDQYPLWGDTVEVQTWFQENRHGTRRDWAMKDVKTGVTIGRATSTWVMMKQETRRFARVTDEIRAEFVRYALHPPRFSFPVDHNTYQKQSLARLEQPLHHVRSLKPRRVDLDMNHHVNNVAYIGWMIESLPAMEKTHELRSIILEFKHECNHDDSVESMAAQAAGAPQGEQEFLHLLTLEGTTREINRGWTRWVQRKEEAEVEADMD